MQNHRLIRSKHFSIGNSEDSSIADVSIGSSYSDSDWFFPLISWFKEIRERFLDIFKHYKIIVKNFIMNSNVDSQNDTLEP